MIPFEANVFNAAVIYFLEFRKFIFKERSFTLALVNEKTLFKTFNLSPYFPFTPFCASHAGSALKTILMLLQ